jgi:tetratricopeptide (TPR) repeat protein
MKPENVLMDDQGNCFLADFGISRLLDDSAASLTGTDNFIGTPEYVAPEQIMGRAVTPASDVYALGLILYEMICGEMIFHGETPFSIINHHLNTPPAIPPEKRPDLPPIARDVVLKALAKDPADRYASAGEMADAFSQAIRDQAVAPTEKSTLPPRPAPPQEKNVRPITLLPVIVAAVLITAVIALLVFSGGEDPAFYKQAAQTAAAQDDGESAIQYWRAFLELQPDDAGARHSLAERLNLRGLQALQALDYDAALADFQEAVEYAPDYASPHFNMGIVYEEQRQFEEAQVAYEAALAANDQFLMARYRLGEMLLDRGEEESTAEQVERGFDVIDIGINMLNKGDLASEIEDKIRERYTFLLYTARGRAYYLRGGKGNFQLAESDLKRALAYQSAVERPAEAYYYLALLYESQGKAGDAREMWLNVIRYHDPDNNREREWRAEAQEVMSDKDE